MMGTPRAAGNVDNNGCVVSIGIIGGVSVVINAVLRYQARRADPTFVLAVDGGKKAPPGI